jgi:glycosyltransferase involved in cell wall biosynthesis
MAPRIILLHYTAPPVVGGVESVVGTQARLLRQAGHEVWVVAGRGRHGAGCMLVPLLYGRHPEVRAAHAALRRGDAGPVQEVGQRVADELAELLSGSVCVVHNAFTMAKNLPLLWALHRLVDRALGCRWVAWTHDVVWDNPQELARVPEGPFRALLRTARPEVTYVAITETVRASLVRHLGLPQAAVTVIPPGTSLDALQVLGSQARRVLEALSWDAYDPVLLVPVRVTRRKNLELAVGVAAALRARGRRPLVVVTGPLGAHNPANARYLAELQALRESLGVEEHVVFLAERGVRCSPRTVGQLYLACDGVLLTSTWEGFGLPVAEAGLLRVPVFCSRIPALREVAGEDAHFFGPEETPEAVADLVLRALSEERASRLRRRVRDNFGWERLVRERLVPLLNELAKAGGAPTPE